MNFSLKVQLKKKEIFRVSDNHRTCVAEERIDFGGFSEVFKGRKLDDGSFVAIKVPKGVSEKSTIKPETRECFLREGKLWSMLNHRNIVKVYDCGDSPFPWICMEYMDADSLREKIAEFELHKRINVIFGILNGLEYAHSKNIIHRDIKPENVLFSSTQPEVPKLTD